MKSLIILFNFLLIAMSGYTQNVGIGTTTPEEKLEVVGNVKLSGSTTNTIYADTNLLIRGWDGINTTTTRKNGGNITLRGGSGYYLTGIGGNLNLQGGNSGTQQAAGEVRIYGGSSNQGRGGHVRISAGTTNCTGASDHADVLISGGIVGPSEAASIICEGSSTFNCTQGFGGSLILKAGKRVSGISGTDGVIQLLNGNINIGTSTTISKFEIDTSGNIKKINGIAYSFPSTQGSSGQVLKTNGSGVFSWQNDSMANSSWSANGSNIYNNNSGNIGVGTSTPNTSAIVELSSTSKGFLPPRMTTTQRTAISSPPEGLCVYDLTLHKLFVFDGTVWQAAW